MARPGFDPSSPAERFAGGMAATNVIGAEFFRATRQLDAVMGRRFKGSQVGWLSLRMMVLEKGSE